MSGVFVWQGVECGTIRDLMDAVFAIDALPDPEDRQRTADAFMEAYRAFTEHADANVGYLTGYTGHDQMVRLLELFGTTHPIFGGPKTAAAVTPEGAFEAGKLLGGRMRQEARN